MAKTRKKTSKKSTTGAKKATGPARRSLGEGGASKDAAGEKQSNTGQRRGPRAKRPSGLDAAVKILGEAGKPMSCKQILERMLAAKLWQTSGKTPAATISAAITREIANKGEASRFRKVAPGRFILNK